MRSQARILTRKVWATSILKIVDTKEVQCYNCQGFGHYARDCRRKKSSKMNDSDEVQYARARDSGSNDMLLMVNTQSNTDKNNMWYMDSGCSNQMADNRN